MHEPPGSRLLSRREAGEALGVSVDTVARLIRRGELGHVRIGRSVLVPASEVQSFVDRRLSKSDDAPMRARAES